MIVTTFDHNQINKQRSYICYLCNKAIQLEGSLLWDCLRSLTLLASLLSHTSKSFTITNAKVMQSAAINHNIVRKVSASKLGVSKPDPSWFGNSPNKAKNPHWTNTNWPKSRFHFSFAEYNNPCNTNFGLLRVMNDDLVRGLGKHPHRDADEICTYIIE